jgi:hypothetical protein
MNAFSPSSYPLSQVNYPLSDWGAYSLLKRETVSLVGWMLVVVVEVVVGGSKLTSPAECVSEWGQVLLQWVSGAIAVTICRSSVSWRMNEVEYENSLQYNRPLPPSEPYQLVFITQNSLFPPSLYNKTRLLTSSFKQREAGGFNF